VGKKKRWKWKREKNSYRKIDQWKKLRGEIEEKINEWEFEEEKEKKAGQRTQLFLARTILEFFFFFLFLEGTRSQIYEAQSKFSHSCGGLVLSSDLGSFFKKIDFPVCPELLTLAHFFCLYSLFFFVFFLVQHSLSSKPYDRCVSVVRYNGTG
jgi:hypothetical protein